MADYRAIIFDGTSLKKIPDADSLFIGAGIKTRTGNLTITPTGTDIVIAAGKALSAEASSCTITGFGSIDVASDTDTIGGIQRKNLLDKTAAETITGGWLFNASSLRVASMAFSSTQATLLMDSPNVDGDVTYTAKRFGKMGNSIRVAHIDPGAAGPLSISVVGNDINITLAHDGTAVTSTALDVANAVNADAAASALVTATYEGTGGGIVVVQALTNLSGGYDDLSDIRNLSIDNNVDIGGNLTVQGTQTIVGSTTFTGATVFGDTTADTVEFVACMKDGTDLTPQTTGGASIGSSTLRFNMFGRSVDIDNGLTLTNVGITMTGLDLASSINRAGTGYFGNVDSNNAVFNTTCDVPSGTGFKIAGTALTTANFTAPNIDTILNGSDADSLHTHSQVVSKMTKKSFTNSSATESILAGDVVAITGNEQVFKADDTTNWKAIGVAESDIAAGGTGFVIRTNEAVSVRFVSGLTVSPGDKVFVSNTPGLATNVAPTASGTKIVPIGKIIDTTNYATLNQCDVELDFEAPIEN